MESKILNHTFFADLNKELKSLEIDEQVSTLETLIVIAEHYVKSGDVEGFRKNIRRPDNFLLSCPRPNISDLKTMADNMEQQKLIFRAVMVHKAIAALLKYEYKHRPDLHHQQADIITPNDAVSGIIKSMEKVFHLCVSTTESEEDAERNSCVIHVIPIFYDMLTNLREIRHANRKYRAGCEAWGLLFLALAHGTLGEYVEMQNVLDTSVKAMMRRFKRKCPKHFIYGLSCVALAIAEVCVGGGSPPGVMDSGVKSIQESADVTTWDAKVNIVSEVRELSDMMRDCVP